MNPERSLTLLEPAIFHGVGSGRTNREISAALAMPEDEVQDCLSKICEKLAVPDRLELIALILCGPTIHQLPEQAVAADFDFYRGEIPVPKRAEVSYYCFWQTSTGLLAAGPTCNPRVWRRRHEQKYRVRYRLIRYFNQVPDFDMVADMMEACVGARYPDVPSSIMLTEELREWVLGLCGCLWSPKVKGKPKQCPKCHQSKWNIRPSREQPV